MPDPLLALLATIERLDREATRGPWRACCADREHACRTGIVWADDGETNIASGPDMDCSRPTPEQIVRNTILIVTARNAIAPLASMLRVAVEAMEPFARYAEKMKPGPLPDTACVAVHHDNVNGDTEITIADLKRARAALATIRRMAEEVSR